MLPSRVMFTKRTTAALFAIAIASSLIVASGFIGFAFAAKKETQREESMGTISDNGYKSISPKPQFANPDDSNGAQQDSSGASRSSDLKKLSKCESGAAEDGDLTLAEVKDCYGQLFDQGQA
jgi:hypothetical protein